MSTSDQQPFRLDDTPREHPFRVPEDYFAQLPERLQRQTTTRKVAPWWALGGSTPRYRTYLVPGLATLLLLVISIAFWFRPGDPASATSEELLAQVPAQELRQWLDTAPLSDYELVELATQLDEAAIPEPAFELNASARELQEEIELYDTNEDLVY
ncbi:hypothetical protein SAMN05421823_10651 [Catalinimonas alkaloidigena]|uniref:Uncharacterized protein n=1 Tax=Catalinimonas alkaloidigena TaxID=1075417 RepID=A0A1G9K4W6_9BACT|nr:hypothetical protein [Catalinimonas alkaloidigena]SDL44739.1 hypothetical protein SAMN05421823_10651 [Catalinimonas alkaloidigena]